MIEGLGDDGACELISDAAVADAFGVEVERKQGIASGRLDSNLSYTCDFEPGIMNIRLSTTTAGEPDREILDRWFSDGTKQERPVMDYEDVPDLGVSAGFGRNANLGGHTDSWRLVSLFEIDGERLMFSLTRNFEQPTVDQLRPLVEELMSNLAG